MTENLIHMYMELAELGAVKVSSIRPGGIDDPFGESDVTLTRINSWMMGLACDLLPHRRVRCTEHGLSGKCLNTRAQTSLS